jgi:hypothetical protein
MMTDLDVMLDRLSAEYSKRLSTKGIRFMLGVRRRLRGRGVARAIWLHVWRVTGFDDFEWDFDVSGARSNRQLQGVE